MADNTSNGNRKQGLQIAPKEDFNTPNDTKPKSLKDYKKDLLKAYLKVPKLDYGKIKKNLDDEVHDEFVRLHHPVTRKAAVQMDLVNRETLQQKLWKVFEDHPGLGSIEGKQEREEVAGKIADDIAEMAFTEYYKHRGLSDRRVKAMIRKMRRESLMWEATANLSVFKEYGGRTGFIMKLLQKAARHGDLVAHLGNDEQQDLYGGVLTYMDPLNTNIRYVTEELRQPARLGPLRKKLEQKFGYKLRPGLQVDEMLYLFQQGIAKGYGKDVVREYRALFDKRSLPKKFYKAPTTEPVPDPLKDFKDLLDQEEGYTASTRRRYRKGF